jgi:hypothetical protein
MEPAPRPPRNVTEQVGGGCLVWLALLPLLAFACSGCIRFHPHIREMDRKIQRLENRVSAIERTQDQEHNR